jgi:hypothetical protein
MRHVTPRLQAPSAPAAVIWIAAALAAGGCRDQETSLLIEVLPGSIDVAALDDVSIHVAGPGLEGGERTAWVPVRGAGARPFPLTLVIHGTAGRDGPFAVAAEAHAGGALRASARAPESVALQAGRMIRRQLTLETPATPGDPRDAATADGPPAVDATMVDALAAQDVMVPAIPDAAVDRRPTTNPEMAPDAAGEPPVAPPPEGAPDAASCATCDRACLQGEMAAGDCLPVPEGTPCHGNSGMTCHGCRCGP